jgi:mono/diheme cytochrome c family protein
MRLPGTVSSLRGKRTTTQDRRPHDAGGTRALACAACQKAPGSARRSSTVRPPRATSAANSSPKTHRRHQALVLPCADRNRRGTRNVCARRWAIHRRRGRLGLRVCDLCRRCFTQRRTRRESQPCSRSSPAAPHSLPLRSRNVPPPQPIPDFAAAEVAARGQALFHTYCSVCHGDSAISGGVLPNLRWSPLNRTQEAWKGVVIDGARTERSIASFAPVLSEQDAEAIRAYVVRKANMDYSAANALSGASK